MANGNFSHFFPNPKTRTEKTQLSEINCNYRYHKIIVLDGLSQLTSSGDGLAQIGDELERLAEDADEILAVENGDEKYES